MIKRAGLLLAAIALLIASGTAIPSTKTVAAYGLQSQKAARDTGVSSFRIMRDIVYLASDKLQGRRAGTPGADRAADYISRMFRASGLKPAAGASYLQPFPFVARVALGEENRFRVKTPTGSRSLKVGEDYMPLAFSSSTPVSGQVVFAGYGISAPEHQYDNYAGIDPAGKIVLIMRGSPDGDNPHGRFGDYTAPGLEIQKKTVKAREKGASGVIFISAEKDFHDDRLARLHHDLNFLDAAIPAVIITRQAAEALLVASGTSLDSIEKRAAQSSAPLAIKDVTIEFKADVKKINGNGANVAGILPGSDPALAKEYIVIGAHYDHLGLGGTESLAENPEGEIHHGADDNASGTAALIELAYVLSADANRPKRSILFIAFSGEELGLLGSAAYTKNPLARLDSTVAMINMDMVGRLRDDSLMIGGVGTSPAWKGLLEGLNGSSSDSPRFQMKFSQDGYGPSDHQSFYVRDLPVLFFFTGTHDDYHKPSDTADKINLEGEKQIVEFVRDLTRAIADEPARIAFTRVKTESRPTGRGFRVYLGTVPNYSDQEDGLKLDGVRAASPAERAGLRAGDVVVKLASLPIRNVYDYTFALGELTPGQEVDIVIRREGREMTLKLTPDKRQ